MVVTVQQSIPMNSRGFFLRERDSLTAQYGVSLKFPNGREFLHGTHQTMLMVGLQSNITAMMPQVRRILNEAHEQYLGYKERQSRRRSNAHAQFSHKKHENNDKKSNSSVRKVNPFAVLEGLHEQETKQLEIELAEKHKADALKEEKKAMKARENDAIANGLAPMPKASRVSTMNFAAAAAKPKEVVSKSVVEKPKVTLIVKKSSAFENMSWGDMVDYESDNEW